MANKKAVDAPRSDLFHLKPYELIIDGVDTDDEDPSLLKDNDRKRMDVDPAELESIRTFGVVTPIQARVRDHNPHVVAGRRRVVMARAVWDEQEKAGTPVKDRIRVPVTMVRGEEVYLFLRARAENSSRRDESPISRGQYAQIALGRGASEKDIAASFGVDVVTVKGYLRLIEADDRVKRAVASGKISATAATQIAKLETHDDQKLALDELLAKGTATHAEARRVVNRARTGKDGVGVVSRKVLRELRETVAEPGEDLNEDYQRGFVSALSIVLGDGDVDADAKKWLTKVQRKKERKKKDKKA